MPTTVKVTDYDKTWSPRSLFHIQYQFEDDDPHAASVCEDLQDILMTYAELPPKGAKEIPKSLWRMVKYRRSFLPSVTAGPGVEARGRIDVIDAYYQTVSVEHTTLLGIFFDTLIRFFLPGRPFDLNALRLLDGNHLLLGTNPGKPTPTFVANADVVTFIKPTA